VKTSGMLLSSPDVSSHSSVSSLEKLLFAGEEDDDDDDFDEEGGKTDQEVSKYSFYDRLEHYMERELIKEENRKSVELAIMVEAGSNVREMGVMTKELRANRFLSEYISIIAEIPDSRFEDDSMRPNMQSRFKGMRKGDMTVENLLRKYESELTTLRRLAYKFPGVGNLSKLPSGTAQLQQLRRPLVAKLWVEKNPVRQVCCIYLYRALHGVTTITPIICRANLDLITMIRSPLTKRFRTVGGSRTNRASIFCRSLSTRTIRISRRSLRSNPPDRRVRC